MKRIYTVTAILFALVANAFGQNYWKVAYNKKSEDSYYLVVPPKTDLVRGVIILLPGFGQTPESIFPETKIHSVAHMNDILTVAVAGGFKLYADEGVIDKLNEVIKHIMFRYDLPADMFIIGGFSAGGTIALRYTEYCFEKPGKVPMQPKGVFTVDSPVDLFDIWDYMQRELKKNYSDAGVGEAKFISEIMIREIGDPVSNKKTYEELTPFETSLETPGNERNLLATSVRVYHDIDVAWQLENRRRSLYDSNALAASEMINRLLLLGNEKAEFMQAKQPGYRSSGFRHPHSWSIVDEIEFIEWAESIFD